MCEKAWPLEIPKPANTKRLVLTVFDGYSEEFNTENLGPIAASSIVTWGCLSIPMLLDDNRKPDIGDVLKAMCSEDCHRILDKDQVKMLPKQIVLLLTTTFELSKEELLRDSGTLSQSEEIQRAKVLATKNDDLKGNETLLDVGEFVLLGKDALQEDSDRGMGGGRSMFFVSKPNVTIPELAVAREHQQLVDAVNKVDCERVKEWLQQHADFYKQLEEDMLSTSLRNSTQDYWDKTVKELSVPIEQYVTVLEEVVLPFNKYPRKRCALKGSSLHLNRIGLCDRIYYTLKD